MADTVPDVTDITSLQPVGIEWTASAVLAAIYSHVFNTSTKFTVDFSNTTTNTGDEGIAISCDKVGEDWQINLRKDAADDIDVSMSPTGAITDPGDSTPTAPTGTTADWSGEGLWDVQAVDTGTVATGSKLWIVELDDSFFVFSTDSTNTYQQNGVHAGLIYIPSNGAEMATKGQDGLGFLVGKIDQPAISMGSADWIGGNGKLHYETNKWGEPTILITPAIAHAPDGTDGETNVIATAIPVRIDIGGNSPIVGALKYYRTVGSPGSAKTRRDVATSNQAWMYIRNDSGVSIPEVIPWDKTVTP